MESADGRASSSLEVKGSLHNSIRNVFGDEQRNQSLEGLFARMMCKRQKRSMRCGTAVSRTQGLLTKSIDKSFGFPQDRMLCKLHQELNPLPTGYPSTSNLNASRSSNRRPQKRAVSNACFHDTLDWRMEEGVNIRSTPVLPLWTPLCLGSFVSLFRP